MNFFGEDDEDYNTEGIITKESVIDNSKIIDDLTSKTVTVINEYVERLNEYENINDFPYNRNYQPILQALSSNQENFYGIFNLIQTNDKIFNKIACTFVYLDLEVARINQEFELHLYYPLILYGIIPENTTEGGSNSTSNSTNTGANNNMTNIEASKLNISTSSALSSALLGSNDEDTRIIKLLPILKMIIDYMRRLNFIMMNILNQLHALYLTKDKYLRYLAKTYSLYSALETLSKACTIIYNISAIIKNNNHIKEDWMKFKKAMKSVVNNSDNMNNYDVTKNQLDRLNKILSRYDQSFFSNDCFMGVIKQKFDQNIDNTNKSQVNPNNTKLIEQNAELYELFMEYIKLNVEHFIDLQETNVITNERKEILNMLCLYALSRKIYAEKEDRKLWKKIWSLQKKTPVIIIASNIMITIHEFMSETAPLARKAKTKDPKDPRSFLESYIEEKDINFEKEMTMLFTNFCGWATKMDSSITKSSNFADKNQSLSSSKMSESRNTATSTTNTPTSLNSRNLVNAKIIEARVKQIMTGFYLAYQIKNTFIPLTLLHYKQKKLPKKSMIHYISLGFMMLKGIKSLFIEHQEGLSCTLLSRELADQIYIEIGIYSSTGTKLKEKPLLMNAQNLILSILKGAHSPLRRSIVKYCMNFIGNRKDGIAKDKSLADLQYRIWRWDIIADFRMHIDDATDCSVLYWMKDLIPFFYSEIYRNPNELKRIKFLNMAIADVKPQLKTAVHLDGDNSLYEEYKKEVLNNFNKEILKNVCKDIDEFLRMQIHYMLIDQFRVENPFKVGVKEYKRYLDTDVELFDTIISIKDQVAKQLDEVFYNLNALNMHDYETYEAIRNLGQDLFGLELIHAHIPSQSLERGSLDILSIMRSIQGFVNKFNYNLYTQTFIESTKDSKILNTIGIQQIADSLQTHGVGILNTSVNFVYQFIIKKFNTFSQFLYDDLIQSPIVRENRWFKENKESTEGRYPYEHAEALGKEIKRLGAFEDGKTYLDKFRLLITMIGNALGFVRLMRSASISYCSKHIEFLPYSITFNTDDLSGESFYENAARHANFSNATINTAIQLDTTIKELRMNFSERTDFLRMLVKVFEGLIADSDTKHLDIFYQLLPSLIINYIEANLLAKDKLIKKKSQDTYICDDGFPLGVAYFLKLLNQNDKFDSLHWFDEIEKKFARDTQTLKEREETSRKPGANKFDDEANVQLQMTMRKLTNQKDEFDTFHYSFRASRILFRELKGN